ncbi:MAG: thrombospondin type 3 repeat-containing protein, partial [Roseiflexaceae bacterium]
PDTIADVVGRYFPMLRDNDGVMTGIRTPKFTATASVPRGCTPTLVGSGVNQVKWCEFALNKTQWMEILTDGVSVSQDIALAPASAGGKVVLRMQRDSDGDGYSDATEQEYGTSPTNGSQRPVPELVAGLASRDEGGTLVGTLAFANMGEYPASGVKATMFSPSTATVIRNRQVGGSGEVPAQSTLVIGSGSTVNQDASNWTGSAQPVIDGYYTGASDTQYTLTVVCASDPCAVGADDVTLTWVDSQSHSGSLVVGST